MTSAVELALHALYAETIAHFPTVQAALPEASGSGRAAAEAAAWAAQIAGQGRARQPHLEQKSQRTTTLAALAQPPKEALAARRFVPLQALSLDALLPQERQAAAASAYDALIAELQSQLTACRSLPPAAHLVSANDILRRHAWCLPSPYAPGDEPALSLYDHSRVVAALAPCYRPGAGEQEVVATLISGDISGIQDFIYTITARGATPGLRGRSFYLQLLTEAIARYLLRQLGDLPPTSVLYASGGHFYLLAPGDQTAALAALRRDVSQRLFAHHRDLYVGLGGVSLRPADFLPENFPVAWRRLSQALSQAKNRRFQELGETMFDTLFQPDKRGGEKSGECRVCHYEWDPDEAYEQDDERLDDEGDPIRKCQMCASLENLGNTLRNAQYLHWQAIEPQQATRKDWPAALAAFGAKAQLYASAAELPGEGALGEIWAFNDAALAAAAPLRGRYPIKLSYIVNVTPVVTGEDQAAFREAFPNTPPAEQPRPDSVKPFTWLESQAKGVKRLGVLRLDVDDLGKLFQQGFGANSGLVQSVALSATVSLFFEGWVGRLLTEIDPENRDVLYSIYSGGDDLFIVGAWDLLPPLARRIAVDWHEAYGVGNPALHVSAGITMHSSKYPLYQAARAAGKALDAAKDYEDAQGNQKNAFSFLGRTFPWSAFANVLADKTTLSRLEAQPDIGRSLLHHLLRLDRLYHDHLRQQIEAGVSQPTVYWGRGLWLHVYQMSRLAGRLKGTENQAARADVLAIRDKLRGENFTYIRLLGLSARWAELETRRERQRS